MFAISQTSGPGRTKVASVSSTLTPPFNPFSTTVPKNTDFEHLFAFQKKPCH